MTDSLRALLTGAIDYAGMFPPASLSREESLANWRRYRAGPHAWMLGRFVCPAASLGELSTFDPRSDGSISVVAPQMSDHSLEYKAGLDQLRTQIAAFPGNEAIQLLEFRWPAATANSTNGREFFQLIGDVRIECDGPICPTLFFEPAPTDASTNEELWCELMQIRVSAVFQFNRRSVESAPRVGFKLRMGGSGGSPPPSAESVAWIICACREAGAYFKEAGAFWKATAGLHHAMTRVDPRTGTREHGFLNLFVAAILADAQGLTEEAVQEILEDEDPAHLRFTRDGLNWREFSATVAQITAARRRALRSIGSCSFEEPVADLRALGLL